MSKRSTEADQGSGSAEGRRTEVFISATSGDLRSVREMVKQGLLTLGCFPIEQTNFEPDYRTVRQMLETRIAQCDAVIHVVGVRYGAEPDPGSVPEGQTRRSYTQMEAEIARKLGKKLYVFLCEEDFPYDQESPAESDEKRELQRAYRQQVAGRESLHTPVRSREDIALKVRELKFELEKLKGTIARDRTRTFAVLAGLLIALAVISTGDAGLWAEPRNAFAWFLIQRGITVEPAKGNVKLKEAAEICQGTLTLNQRGKSPQGLAHNPEQSGRRALRTRLAKSRWRISPPSTLQA